MQLETIFKEASSPIKNPALRVKWREGLLSCCFSSLCLKNLKSCIFQWKVPEPGLEPFKCVSPTVGSLTSSQQAPGLGRSPTRRGEQPPRVSSRSARAGHGQVSPPLFIHSGTPGAEGDHQCGTRRKEDPPSPLSGTGWLLAEVKAGFARLQGHGLLSDQWAGGIALGWPQQRFLATPAPASS